MKKANITLEVDDFFTDTRVVSCSNISCKSHNLYDGYLGNEGKQLVCKLKTISIDNFGHCEHKEIVARVEEEVMEKEGATLESEALNPTLFKGSKEKEGQ